MPFRDTVGHRRLLTVLARSADRGSLPPALIFGGPEGVGKRRIAIALAQLLNCLDVRRSEGGLPDACGICTACDRIRRNIHPDVVMVEPGDSGSIKIEPIRDVIDRAAYRPFEGRRRVVIVNDADAMVSQAQNSLLKTLEEPPPGSVFILVTSHPDALLPTVRSRCPLLRFQPLSAEDVASVLMAGTADPRKKEMNETEARAVAATSEGSISQALAASGGDLVETREKAARVLANLGSSSDPRARIGEAKALLPPPNSNVVGAEEREHVARHLKAMAALIRDVALLSTGADPARVVNQDARATLGQLSAFGGRRGAQAFAAVEEALRSLDFNANGKIVADWVVLQL